MVLAVTVDVTVGRQAEEDLRAERAELGRMARVTTVGAMTASIAHELRQPPSPSACTPPACLPGRHGGNNGLELSGFLCRRRRARRIGLRGRYRPKPENREATDPEIPRNVRIASAPPCRA
jgi:hypothetical protein